MKKKYIVVMNPQTAIEMTTTTDDLASAKYIQRKLEELCSECEVIIVEG